MKQLLKRHIKNLNQSFWGGGEGGIRKLEIILGLQNIQGF